MDFATANCTFHWQWISQAYLTSNQRAGPSAKRQAALQTSHASPANARHIVAHTGE
jgi:hypothetical protein